MKQIEMIVRVNMLVPDNEGPTGDFCIHLGNASVLRNDNTPIANAQLVEYETIEVSSESEILAEEEDCAEFDFHEFMRMDKEDSEKNYFTLRKKSVLTGNVHSMVIPMSYADYKLRLKKWEDGALIQDAFGDLPADTREFIKSGITPAEWDAA